MAKSRFGSVDDRFIPLYYEKSTKRLLNDKFEYIKYGWDKEITEEDEMIALYKERGWLPKDYTGGFLKFDKEGRLI